MLPLQGTMGQRFNYPRPMPGDSTSHYVFYDGAIVPSVVQPVVYNRSHTIKAEVTVPKGGAEGVIYASGANTGGYSLFVKDKKLHFTYNYLTRKFFRIVADDELPEGDLTILYEFEVTGKADPSEGRTERPAPARCMSTTRRSDPWTWTSPCRSSSRIEGLSVGHDYGDSVDHANYEPPFPFTGHREEGHVRPVWRRDQGRRSRDPQGHVPPVDRPARDQGGDRLFRPVG